MADQAPKPGHRLKGPALAAFIVASVAAVAPTLTQPNEGYVAKARPDPVGIMTGCYGETQAIDPLRVYSKSECGVLLRARMAKDYGPAVVRCVPDLADPAHAFALQATTDAAYNTGPRAFCRSRIAQLFNAHRWAEGCRAFIGWYTTGKRRLRKGEHARRGSVEKVIGGVRYEVTTLPGLVRRRREESNWCLTGRLK